MAKRKRLTPAQPDYFNTTARAAETRLETGPETGLETKSMPGPGFSAPPIAQVASDAATRAALDEVTDVLRDARQEGRLIEALPLEAVNAHYLVRDRLVQDDDEMAALMASIRARGQQTPIEVTALPVPDHGPAYGLITGWRRLTALNRLYQETSDTRFSTIKALVVNPDTVQDAYVAMVEENEIRVNLSLFERANIARRAAEEGIFPTARHAVLGLFESTTRSKRSKIHSFVTLVQALDSVLRFPAAIPEKLGLTLARALAADAGLAKTIRNRLFLEVPQNAADELRILALALTPVKDPVKAAKTLSQRTESQTEPDTAPASSASYSSVASRSEEVSAGLWMRLEPGRNARIELSGKKVDEALYRALKDWLVASANRSAKTP